MKNAFVLFASIIFCHFLLAGNGDKTGGKFSLSSQSFIENKGQIIDQDLNPNPEVQFLLCSSGFNVQLKKTGFSYDVYWDEKTKKRDSLEKINIENYPKDSSSFIRHFYRIDIDFLNCNSNSQIIATRESSSYLNYFTAETGVQGINHVHQYQKVFYKNIYPNIDLEFITCP